MITIDTEHLGIPETIYNSSVTLCSSEFTRICRELYTMNESVRIIAGKDQIKFEIENESYGGGFHIDANSSDNLDEQCIIHTDTEVDLSFALRYLNMFTKASSISQQVSLYLSKEYPLMVQYKLAELGTLKFYLAPRIDDSKNP